MRAFHDKNADYDGVFYVAVNTTGIFCRPSCPSQPNAENIEFFASGRVGATAVTFQHVSWDDVVLYPKIGITGQIEAGVRGPRFFVSAFSELHTWGQSAVVRG